MDGRTAIGVWEGARTGADEEKLDRALVAGLMLEVILETADFPRETKTHRDLVKNRLKDALVVHLAGRVTLERFHHLLRQLDRWFPVYYPLIITGSPERLEPAAPSSATAAAVAGRALREDLMHSRLRAEVEDLLPRRPHRKVHPEKLLEFLSRTQGGWFRLKDFEQHFAVDRKTAWEYVQKLLTAGVLRHNRRRSAAVRYALETPFLVGDQVMDVEEVSQ
jgi:hypothetical protein